MSFRQVCSVYRSMRYSMESTSSNDSFVNVARGIWLDDEKRPQTWGWKSKATHADQINKQMKWSQDRRQEWRKRMMKTMGHDNHTTVLWMIWSGGLWADDDDDRFSVCLSVSFFSSFFSFFSIPLVKIISGEDLRKIHESTFEKTFTTDFDIDKSKNNHFHISSLLSLALLKVCFWLSDRAILPRSSNNVYHSF